TNLGMIRPIEVVRLEVVFDTQEDRNEQGSNTSLKRPSRSCGRSMFWSRGARKGGRTPPDRRERADVLSVAPGVPWRLKTEQAKRPKDLELENSRQGGFRSDAG